MPFATVSLSRPAVDEAPDDVLDPDTIPASGATVRIKPYDDMAFRDHVYLFVGEHYQDDLPISANAVGKDITFTVAASEFIAADGVLPIRYEVQFHGGAREPSQVLNLVLQSGFESDATLDLTSHNYVAAVEKPPLSLPIAARMTREAQWGEGPYRYASSDPGIAKVDELTGEVNAIRNGQCTISATDKQGKTASYLLTIKGIQEVHFLSHSADWQGMASLCNAAGLKPVSLVQIKRLWTLYFPDTGPVGDYLEWLNYPVWTGDSLGAGTAWVYDLNGASVNENASGQSMDTFWQVLGISQT
jgi:hypothetical protein